MNELASMEQPQWPLIRSAELDDRKSLTMAHQVAQSAGFAIFDYAGHILSGHDGGELGYSTLLRMDRSRGLAVIVLVNNALDDNGRFAKTVIANSILDWHYGLPAIDRTPFYLAEYEKAAKLEVSGHEERVQRENAGRNTRIKPSLKSQAYAGTYEHPFAGELRVTAGGGNRLNATVGESADWVLTPWRGDIFEAQWLGAMPYRQFFRFDVSPEGEVTLLEILGDGLRYRKQRNATSAN
jgi:hypothetical protein